MSKPGTWYIVKFPDTFRNQTYFSERDLAERYVMHVGETKGIWGKVVEVQEVKRKKKK